MNTPFVSKVQKAAMDRFASGLYCAEGVALALSDELGVESALLPRIATAFCSGMGRMGARAYAESSRQRRSVDAPVSTLLADGMACRSPNAEAIEIIWHGVDRIVEVTDAEVAEAMRTLFECTHNVGEGAGAAPLAAALQKS